MKSTEHSFWNPFHSLSPQPSAAFCILFSTQERENFVAAMQLSTELDHLATQALPPLGPLLCTDSLHKRKLAWRPWKMGTEHRPTATAFFFSAHVRWSSATVNPKKMMFNRRSPPQSPRSGYPELHCWIYHHHDIDRLTMISTAPNTLSTRHSDGGAWVTRAVCWGVLERVLRRFWQIRACWE